MQLYVYDLSQGFAAQVSQALLGKHVSDCISSTRLVFSIYGRIWEALPA